MMFALGMLGGVVADQLFGAVVAAALVAMAFAIGLYRGRDEIADAWYGEPKSRL